LCFAQTVLAALGLAERDGPPRESFREPASDPFGPTRLRSVHADDDTVVVVVP
jgi:hypothetical protein